MKRISILLVLCLTLILAGCNKSYNYLYEQDYAGGKSSRVIIYTYQDYLAQEMVAATYNEAFFENNDLVIFRFNYQYTESDIRITAAKRNGHNIKIDIKLKSPAKNNENAFDAQISCVYLVAPIAKYCGDQTNEPDQVGITVINERHNNSHCSIYYDCSRNR